MQAGCHQDTQRKKWTKELKGNKILADVKNPLRNYIEKELPTMDLSCFPNRPKNKVDLSIGDPTISLEFRTHNDNLKTIANCVGKVDGYTDMQGLDEAREAVSAKFSAPAYKILKDNVYMTSGGSMAIWAVMNLLAEAGDNFLFPSPGFPLSLTIAKSMEVEPRFYTLKAQDKWQADIEQMESLIDAKTRFIYVNDPSNPLGSCWSAQHKKQILDLCRKKNIPLLSDEIYEGVTYENPVNTFAQYSTEDVTIFKCSGLTKRWLGPGWRLGWIIVYAKQQTASYYNKYLRGIFNILLMPHTVMQAAVKEIINNPINDEHLHSRMELMRQNKELLVQELANEPYCRFGDASGALYATIILKLDNFDEHINKSTINFSKLLFAEQNVMIFPGQFFASQVPFIRLVISCNLDKIKEFLNRFKRFCRAHMKQ